MSLFSGVSNAYRNIVTNPNDRNRGKDRSEYIQGLITQVEEATRPNKEGDNA